MQPFSSQGNYHWNNNNNQINNQGFSSTNQEILSSNQDLPQNQQQINNSRMGFPCYCEDECIFSMDGQIDSQDHPIESIIYYPLEKQSKEMKEFPIQQHEDIQYSHQPTSWIFEGQERFLKQEWKFKCLEEEQKYQKHGQSQEQQEYMFELEKEQPADNNLDNSNDRFSSLPQIKEREDSEEQWQPNSQPHFFSELSPLFKRNSISFPITPPVSPLHFREFEEHQKQQQSQIFFGFLEGEQKQQYESEKELVNVSNHQGFEFLPIDSQKGKSNDNFRSIGLFSDFNSEQNQEIIQDQSQQKSIQIQGNFIENNETTDQIKQVVQNDPKTAKLKLSTNTNITITSQSYQPQKGRIRTNIYQGSDELHNSHENYEDIGKLGKKNIVRNLLRAFARFFFAKNSLKESQLLGTQTESEIKTQFRRYFHQKGFNNSVIKQLVQHPTYGKIFKYFLEKQAMDYLMHSNVKAKENHQKFIEYILSCFADIKLLRNLETYSKLKI